MTRVVLFVSDEFAGAASQALGEDWSVEFFEPLPGSSDLFGDLSRLLVSCDADIVAIEPGHDLIEALELVRAIDRAHPSVTTVLIRPPSTSVFQAALRVGVREVLDPFSSPDEISAAFARVAEVSAHRRALQRERAPEEPLGERGRIATVTSPKGGSGKTVVSTNLGVALAARDPGQVVLVDLDLQFGDVANALGLAPSYSMYTATQASGSEATLLRAFLTPHDSGLFVLCAPDDPTEADDVKEGDAVRIIQELSRIFRWVIVDTGAGLDDMTVSAAEVSTDLIFISSTDVPSVKGLRKELAIMDQLGVRARRHLVLNRSDARVGLVARDISESLGLPITVEVPSSRSVPVSVNAGEPIVGRDSRNPAARALDAFAGRLFDESRAAPAAKSWRSFRR